MVEKTHYKRAIKAGEELVKRYKKFISDCETGKLKVTFENLNEVTRFGTGDCVLCESVSGNCQLCLHNLYKKYPKTESKAAFLCRNDTYLNMIHNLQIEHVRIRITELNNKIYRLKEKLRNEN